MASVYGSLSQEQVYDAIRKAGEYLARLLIEINSFWERCKVQTIALTNYGAKNV